jgi:hypothetical protein
VTKLINYKKNFKRKIKTLFDQTLNSYLGFVFNFEGLQVYLEKGIVLLGSPTHTNVLQLKPFPLFLVTGKLPRMQQLACLFQCFNQALHETLELILQSCKS